MRRSRVIFRKEARASLKSILRLLVSNGASRQTASRFIARIADRAQRIGDVPFGGRPRDDLTPGLRTVPFEDRAVIAYVVRNDMVEIVDIFYGGRDYEALYREGGPEGG